MDIRTGKSWTMVLGDSRNLGALENCSVQLVLTSPPFFPPLSEHRLMRPRQEQDAYDAVREEVSRYALSLAPHFLEMARVVSPGCHLVIHTKDIRYGEALLPLSQFHRQMAEAAGFVTKTRVFWHKCPIRRGRSRAFVSALPKIPFQVDDLEELLVLKKPGPEAIRLADLSISRATELSQPVWRFPALGSARTHPYQSPPELFRRFVELLSNPGDLVLDPFAGHGTSLRAAVGLGRKAIGWEMDRDHFDRAVQYLGSLKDE